MPYYVYILASGRRGTLYVGVTNDLIRRVYEHRNHLIGGFTAKYNVTRLVYFEIHDEIEGAILREKRVKRWRRDWKIELIEAENKEWRDLWPAIAQPNKFSISSRPSTAFSFVIPDGAQAPIRDPNALGNLQEKL